MGEDSGIPCDRMSFVRQRIQWSPVRLDGASSRPCERPNDHNQLTLETHKPRSAIPTPPTTTPQTVG